MIELTVSEQIDAWWRGLTESQRVRACVTWQQVLEGILGADWCEAEPMLFRLVDEALRVHGFARKRVSAGETRVWAWVKS